MPKTNIRSFTGEWLELFQWFEEHEEEPKSFTTTTEKQARTLRSEFYSARAAMQKDEAFTSMYKQALLREVVIEGTVVTFRNRDRTPIAEVLRRGLAEDAPKPAIHKPDGDASYDEGN